ncbi:helix-turn-helix domain-containing protein [Pedobacter arcticus]|uniref:helix-turn-helix domain-containing protein n=1 Tax=Pedobacter arcticus TaxID=752140 RepID=UPI0002FA2B8C
MVAIENFSFLVSNLKNEIVSPNNFAHKDFLKHFLKLFLISIQRLGERNNCKNSSISNQQNITLLKFKQSLELNFKNIHTVKEYANILNISSKTLTNHTTEIALKTPLQLINDRITLEAKRLLSHSSLNINEIGFQLGYEDPSYFVKFFKRQTKKSPSEFRKAVS